MQQTLLIARWCADAVTFLSCMTISVGIFLALRRRDDLYYKYILELFAAVVLAYAVTLAVDAFDLRRPLLLAGTACHAAAAVVSAFAAARFAMAAKGVLARPSRVQLRAVTEALELRNVEFGRVNAELEASRRELKRRVEDRTAELSQAIARSGDREAYFRALYQVTPIMMHTVDRTGRILDVNDFWISRFGYSREEAMGRRAQEFAFPKAGLEAQQGYRADLWRLGACDRLPYVVRRKDGATFEAEFSAVVHGQGDDARAFVVVVDVSAREEAERRLRANAAELAELNARLSEREAHYRELYKITPVMMHTLDRGGRIQEINDRWSAQMGYSAEEVIGHEGREIMAAWPPPEEAARLRDQLWATGAWDRVRYTLKRRDGEPFEVEFSAVIHGEGEEARAFVVAVDVTAREAAERETRTKASDLQRANESLAQFAYVASHDLQEPLRKIITFADILSTAVKNNDRADIDHALPVISDAAARARQLVVDLLAYSRYANAERDLSRFDLSELVAATLTDLSLTIAQSGAQIEVAIATGEVEADRSQFAQVLQNLISNALKYRNRDATPNIRVTATATDDDLSVEIADNGIGFEPRYAEIIFEPFKRLHGRGAYPGTGIGLAICKTICDRHGWCISARGEPGAGATFRILMPNAAPSFRERP
jgi:PAS domain S-box-containing protein